MKHPTKSDTKTATELFWFRLAATLFLSNIIWEGILQRRVDWNKRVDPNDVLTVETIKLTLVNDSFLFDMGEPTDCVMMMSLNLDDNPRPPPRQRRHVV